MKRCKTCKHWKTEGGWHDIERPLDEDTYQPKVLGYEVRRCEHPEKTFCETPISRDGFGLADGSGYMANLYTAEDFGCVRHER